MSANPESPSSSPEVESAPPPAVRAPSVPPNLHPGLRVGSQYELVRKLGTGSMGEVWAAKHLSLDEEVAIKLVMRTTTHEDGTTAESRFLLEARVAAALSRKTRHIVNVTDYGEDGDYAYLVMDLLRGEALDARLARKGPLSIAKAVPLVYQVARALSVAHNDGIVHRDLKPSNIFVTTDEEGRSVLKILDFGIAKLRESRRRISLTEAKHETLRGVVLGTPAYMSPEQARGRAIDHRTDVWALAVMAYHFLTGAFPFDGESTEELFARIATIDPIPIEELRPDLPPVVSDFFKRAFALHINQRFQSAVALAGAFEQLEPLARGVSPTIPPPLAAITAPPPPVAPTPRTTPSTLPGIAAPEIAPLHAPLPVEEEERWFEEAPRSEEVEEKVAVERGSIRIKPAKKVQVGSIIAAGVPSKRAGWGVIAAALILGVLLFTGTLLDISFGRAGRSTGLAERSPVPAQVASEPTERDAIPAPEPVVAAPAELEPAVVIQPPAKPVLPMMSPARLTANISRPEVTPAVPPPATPTASPRKPIDKGEIF